MQERIKRQSLRFSKLIEFSKMLSTQSRKLMEVNLLKIRSQRKRRSLLMRKEKRSQKRKRIMPNLQRRRNLLKRRSLLKSHQPSKLKLRKILSQSQHQLLPRMQASLRLSLKLFLSNKLKVNLKQNWEMKSRENYLPILPRNFKVNLNLLSNKKSNKLDQRSQRILLKRKRRSWRKKNSNCRINLIKN